MAPFANGAFQDINSPDGTWSPWFGHGRVDAQAAVAEAIRRRPPTQQGLRRASAPGLVIPDNVATGVRDSIAFTEAGRVAQMSVSVDIAHSFIGDLAVTLASPSGRTVTLHNRTGGNAANLNRTYRVADTPATRIFGRRTIDGAVELSWSLTPRPST